MNFDDYELHIIQKHRVAVAIAVLKTKPGDKSIEQHITDLKNKLNEENMIDLDLDITLCSDDFNIDIVINDDEFNDNNDSRDVTENSNPILKDVSNQNLLTDKKSYLKENERSDFTDVLQSMKAVGHEEIQRNAIHTQSTLCETSDNDINYTVTIDQSLTDNDRTFCYSLTSNEQPTFHKQVNRNETLYPSNHNINQNDRLTFDSQATEIYTLHGFSQKSQNYTHVSQSQNCSLNISDKFITRVDTTKDLKRKTLEHGENSGFPMHISSLDKVNIDNNQSQHANINLFDKFLNKIDTTKDLDKKQFGHDANFELTNLNENSVNADNECGNSRSFDVFVHVETVTMEEDNNANINDTPLGTMDIDVNYSQDGQHMFTDDLTQNVKVTNSNINEYSFSQNTQYLTEVERDSIKQFNIQDNQDLNSGSNFSQNTQYLTEVERDSNKKFNSQEYEFTTTNNLNQNLNSASNFSQNTQCLTEVERELNKTLNTQENVSTTTNNLNQNLNSASNFSQNTQYLTEVEKDLNKKLNSQENKPTTANNLNQNFSGSSFSQITQYLTEIDNDFNKINSQIENERANNLNQTLDSESSFSQNTQYLTKVERGLNIKFSQIESTAVDANKLNQNLVNKENKNFETLKEVLNIENKTMLVTSTDNFTQDTKKNSNPNTLDQENSLEYSEEELQEELVPFKVVEELNKVRSCLQKRERSYDSSSDSGYRSDSQGRNKSAMQSSGNCLAQSAYCLYNYVTQCPLVATTQEIVTEISMILGQLIDRLHEEETYPPFLEELLGHVDALVHDLFSQDNTLLSKDEQIQRLYILNKSTHIIKHTIEKLTDLLEKSYLKLTDNNDLYELTNVTEIENLSYIFHILEILIKRYLKSKSNEDSQVSQEVNIKRSTIADIWRKKWNPNFNDCKIKESSAKQCVLLKCSEILNKIVVDCMEGYGLVAFAALQCFNLLQS